MSAHMQPARHNWIESSIINSQNNHSKLWCILNSKLIFFSKLISNFLLSLYFLNQFNCLISISSVDGGIMVQNSLICMYLKLDYTHHENISFNKYDKFYYLNRDIFISDCFNIILKKNKGELPASCGIPIFCGTRIMAIYTHVSWCNDNKILCQIKHTIIR